ncbi:MAG: hypothetical protein A2Y25_04610 [Candidatus Melainabacteria bacterium GWF2_37_15]|nr:MAG: hypothetical protein A2Y25_04610 [Candidatus Melainabacteria bacterium GWF2_37_15]
MLQSISPNIRINHNNALSFSGKFQVLQSLFGERFHIPRAVHDARRCSKRIEVQLTSGEVEGGNVVYLENGKFLGVNHYFENPYEIFGVGKYVLKKDTYELELGKMIESSHRLDLAITESHAKGVRDLSRSLPIKIADRSPYINDTVYIIGSNGHWEGQKAIPATVLSKSRKLPPAIDSSAGTEANYYEIKSAILYKHRDKFSAPGLSGSPVVNKKGELVGVAADSYPNDWSKFNVIDLNTIKTFLSTH